MLITVIAGHGEVVTFKRGSGWQHDIGMACRCRPVAFGDDDQFRFLPGANQPVGILMMGKVGTPRPPDEADIREVAIQSVMLVRRARVFQRLDDSRYRDFINGINAIFHRTLH